MKRTVFAIASLLAAATVGAQIYEWKDDKGKTHFSDQPPAGNTGAQRTIDTAPPASSATPQKSTADRELDYRKRQKDAQDKAEQAQKKQTEIAERKDACDAARRLLETLESGERVALRDDKGERYYMDDAQRQQESEKARRIMQSSCQP